MPLPSNATYLLRRFLDTFRLNNKGELFDLESVAGSEDDLARFAAMMSSDSNDYDRLHLQVLGYRPWLFSNLSTLFYITVAFISVWAAVILIQLCVAKSEDRRRNLRLIM